VSLDALYVAYWSLRDPLTQSQSLPVLRALARSGRAFALMTFEQDAWAMSPGEREDARVLLLAEGIRWLPMRYHRRPPIVATLYDVLAGAVVALWASWRFKVRLLHGRGSVAAAIAYLASRLTRRRFFDDADGPLSEEYVDAGLWARGSSGHSLAAWGESRFLASADAVAVLTEHRRGEIAAQARSAVTVLPCAVDTGHFAPDPAARERLRSELGLGGTVLVYAGKSGGWYLTDAMLDFAAVARQVLDDVRLLVLTTEPPDGFERRAAARGLSLVVRRATRQEMPAFLSAGDAGLSFVLSAPSKAAASPVKNGEYLACGLPIVTTPGIGDYSDLVSEERVGVVVEATEAGAYRRAAESLRDLLRDPGLRSRCREVARARVGLEELVVPRYAAIYDALLGPAGGRG
jgi:glycosyltransferase involved in cell wall biosynthesis